MLADAHACDRGARAEAQALTERILDARDAYYGRDTEIVDDATYDEWMHRLEAIERLHPELQGQDSPTLTVGAASGHAVRPGRARRADAEPRQRLQRRGVPRVGGEGRARRGQAGALPVRAQDRRARAVAALRARPADVRRHPRRRPRRRRRHRQRAADRAASRSAWPATGIPTSSRCAARSSSTSPTSSRSTPTRSRWATGCSRIPRNAASGSLRQKTEGKNERQLERDAPAARRGCG